MNRLSFLLRLEVFYIVLTALYWFLAPSPFLAFSNSSGVILDNPFSAFLGLFVPFGPNNTELARVFSYIFPILPVMGLKFFILVIGLLIAFWGEKLLGFLKTEGFVKIALNLAVLLVVTTVIDFILFSHWASLDIFLRSLH